jgi:hypothetical protein
VTLEVGNGLKHTSCQCEGLGWPDMLVWHLEPAYDFCEIYFLNKIKKNKENGIKSDPWMIFQYNDDNACSIPD